MTDTLTDTLTALALLALAWFIMRAVSRAHSTELRRIRDAHDALAHATTTHTHDDATGALIIGEYDDYETLPYADELHDDAHTHETHTTTTHEPDYYDAHDDYDEMPYYMR